MSDSLAEAAPASHVPKRKRPRLGLALALVGGVLLAVPLLAVVSGWMVAFMIAGSIEAVAAALGMTLGGWTGALAPEGVGALVLAGSAVLLALPGVAFLAAGVTMLRRARRA